MILSTQRKPQVSRLRQNEYKKSSSIILSLPAVSSFDKSLLQDTVLTQPTGFLHCSRCALSPLVPRKFLSGSRECTAARAPLLRLSEPGGAVASPRTEPPFFTPSLLPFICPIPPASPLPPPGLQRSLLHVVTNTES